MTPQSENFAIELACLTDKYLSRGLSKEEAVDVIHLLLENFAAGFVDSQVKDEIDEALRRNIG